VNYSELLQLAKGWGNFISDRIIIWRLRYKKYHIKPNVEFSRISQIVMNESEENDAV
jgi:hypothetical protein